MEKKLQRFEKWRCARGEEYYLLGHNDLRRWYQRDIDQIVHSTAFRKLQIKSQLLSEKDPRSRSRLIHTLEVSRIALEICEKLGLNKELTEAICMAHDLGTSAYGYVGNDFLSKKNRDGFFSHECAGARMVETIAKKKLETHLTSIAAKLFKDDISAQTVDIPVEKAPFKLKVSKQKDKYGRTQYFIYYISPEIVDGVEHHGSNGTPRTLEGQVVRYADNIAYLSQDLDDMMFTDILKETEEFTLQSQSDHLSFINKKGNQVMMSFNDIDSIFPQNISLREAFNESRGKRIYTLIDRFVKYNEWKLEQRTFETIKSPFHACDIPVLEMDNGLSFVIDYMWDFIETKYANLLIDTSSKIQSAKMEELWKILDWEDFQQKNEFYRNFIGILEDSRFNCYDDNWKKAYFITHLSHREIDIIIDSFHQRDFTFELDIKENGQEWS